MKHQVIILFLSLIFLSLLTPHLSFAQQETTLYQIETSDGNEFIGQIVFQDQEIIRLKTDKFGELTIRKIDVIKMSEVSRSRMKDGKYWSENPQSARYFWQPNGYGLKEGEAYYQNIWVLFNQVSAGVTDNFSVGFGLVPLFLFGGAPTPVWVTPKFSIPIEAEKVNLGAGVLMGTVLGEPDTGFGIAYGVTTFGSRDENLSLGLGYGYAGGDWANTPTLSLSAMVRTGERGYFITENYYIGSGGENLILLSFGGRRMLKKAGIDFALVVPAIEGAGFFAFPLLGLTFPFNK